MTLIDLPSSDVGQAIELAPHPAQGGHCTVPWQMGFSCPRRSLDQQVSSRLFLVLFLDLPGLHPAQILRIGHF